ncbi:histone-lysine_N-methyltransferase 2A-like isoform X2 [Hexamita inflata]|uniref:Histone-lysine N-methyltransferase 2A-like isoform X2 n=1 Tax=Hexamita inflata TaxID=28002 RepID=A0AA86PSJ3_9EUKA|nr:histone-lysine N-methyltransferase 2A-like isoform X2 [Hexamita inflata]
MKQISKNLDTLKLTNVGFAAAFVQSLGEENDQIDCSNNNLYLHNTLYENITTVQSTKLKAQQQNIQKFAQLLHQFAKQSECVVFEPILTQDTSVQNTTFLSFELLQYFLSNKLTVQFQLLVTNTDSEIELNINTGFKNVIESNQNELKDKGEAEKLLNQFKEFSQSNVETIYCVFTVETAKITVVSKFYRSENPDKLFEHIISPNMLDAVKNQLLLTDYLKQTSFWTQQLTLDQQLAFQYLYLKEVPTLSFIALPGLTHCSDKQLNGLFQSMRAFTNQQTFINKSVNSNTQYLIRLRSCLRRISYKNATRTKILQANANNMKQQPSQTNVSLKQNKPQAKPESKLQQIKPTTRQPKPPSQLLPVKSLQNTSNKQPQKQPSSLKPPTKDKPQTKDGKPQTKDNKPQTKDKTANRPEPVQIQVVQHQEELHPVQKTVFKLKNEFETLKNEHQEAFKTFEGQKRFRLQAELDNILFQVKKVRELLENNQDYLIIQNYQAMNIQLQEEIKNQPHKNTEMQKEILIAMEKKQKLEEKFEVFFNTNKEIQKRLKKYVNSVKAKHLLKVMQ